MPTSFKLQTHPYINCSTPGCTTQTTCFGQNLQTKITTYGDLETFLGQFQCRACRTNSSGKAITTKPARKIRITKKQTRVNKIEELIRTIPAYKPGKSQVCFLKDNPAFVAQITKESGCVRPDIFLDNDRVCDYCPYNQCCQSANRVFSKKYKLPVAA